MLFFSESTQGFYDLDFAKYNLPDDAIEITKAVYRELRSATDQGKKVIVEQGSFVVKNVDITPEQLIDQEHVWLVKELERAGFELDKVQDSDPNSTGTVGDWRTYRKALRVWHDHKDFPKTEFRPKAPDIE